MLHKRISLISLLFIVLVNFQCKKKEDCPEEDQIKAPPEFTSYFYFPVDSWWVYKLQGSNPVVLDTVTVTRQKSVLIDKVEIENYNSGELCSNAYHCNYTHSIKSFFPHPLINAPVEGVSGIFSIDRWELEIGWSNAATERDGVLFYPLTTFCPDSTALGYCPAGYEDIQTPAGAFQHALHFRTEAYRGGASSELKEAWFAPGVGMVKKVYPNQTWELLNYSIK